MMPTYGIPISPLCETRVTVEKSGALKTETCTFSPAKMGSSVRPLIKFAAGAEGPPGPAAAAPAWAVPDFASLSDSCASTPDNMDTKMRRSAARATQRRVVGASVKNTQPPGPLHLRPFCKARHLYNERSFKRFPPRERCGAYA